MTEVKENGLEITPQQIESISRTINSKDRSFKREAFNPLIKFVGKDLVETTGEPTIEDLGETLKVIHEFSKTDEEYQEQLKEIQDPQDYMQNATQNMLREIVGIARLPDSKIIYTIDSVGFYTEEGVHIHDIWDDNKKVSIFPGGVAVENSHLSQDDYMGEYNYHVFKGQEVNQKLDEIKENYKTAMENLQDTIKRMDENMVV
jgi:hypothetical protein